MVNGRLTQHSSPTSYTRYKRWSGMLGDDFIATDCVDQAPGADGLVEMDPRIGDAGVYASAPLRRHYVNANLGFLDRDLRFAFARRKLEFNLGLADEERAAEPLNSGSP